jgi:hypothetical protein
VIEHEPKLKTLVKFKDLGSPTAFQTKFQYNLAGGKSAFRSMIFPGISFNH